MPDPSQRSRAMGRAIGLATAEIRADLNSLIENETVSSLSGGDGSNPVAQTATDDDPTVLEPYGFAGQPGSGTAVVVEPGGDGENRIALGVSAPGGRPALETGDVAVWTVGGHLIELDDDGGLTITARDTGAVTINAGTGASVTINVEVGESVNVGGPAAVALAKAQALLTSIDAAITAALSAALPIVPPDGGDGGTAAFTAFQSTWDAQKNNIPADKAKGE